MSEAAPDPEPEPGMADVVRSALREPFDVALADAKRLRIQAALHGLPPADSMRFTALARSLGLSDGNLAAHLAVLSEVGYVMVSTTYTGKRRTSWYAASQAGRDTFEAHVRLLQAVVDTAAQHES